jgi:hypothetical protein
MRRTMTTNISRQAKCDCVLYDEDGEYEFLHHMEYRGYILHEFSYGATLNGHCTAEWSVASLDGNAKAIALEAAGDNNWPLTIRIGDVEAEAWAGDLLFLDLLLTAIDTLWERHGKLEVV